MQIMLNPYLSFRDDAREAMEFYQTVFGGELNVRTFKDFDASQGSDEDNLVMHANLKTDSGLVLMASDTPARVEYHPGNNVSLSLTGEDEAELRGYFDKLCDGGQVAMPMEKAMWGDIFGMCTDKYGMNWMVDVSTGQTQQ